MIEYRITHYYQPTNHTCSQAALAMLLSYYNKSLNPTELADTIPVLTDEDGATFGSINQQLATWCLGQNFDVTIHSADFQTLDLSWQGFDKQQLLERMRAAVGHRLMPSIGAKMSTVYLQSYINFVTSGGSLHIHPYLSRKLLDEVITNGPFLPAVAYSVLYGEGRTQETGLRHSEPDDVDGSIGTHSIVVYGRDDDGNYLVADPWRKPGRHVIEPERLLAAMSAAQIECDNLLFYVNKRF